MPEEPEAKTGISSDTVKVALASAAMAVLGLLTGQMDEKEAALMLGQAFVFFLLRLKTKTPYKLW